MDDGIDYVQLARYFAGECTKDEQRRVEAWIAADPARGAEAEAAYQVWYASGAAPGTWNADAAWARLTRRLPATAAETPAQDVARRRPWVGPPSMRGPFGRRRAPRSLPGMLVRAAAVLLLVVGGGLAGRSVYERLQAPDAPQVAMRDFVTSRGERAEVTLRDGSTAVLAPATRLSVPASGFRGEARDVYLDGEAYFRVVSDRTRPFLVHATGAVTQVLGTEFGVRAYAADSIVQVAVAEGRVALRSDRAPAGGGAVLTRGQLGSLTRSDTIATVSEADLEAHLGWAEGRLAFRNAPITDVVTQIGRWYDVEVRLADASLASRHLTLSFSDEPLGAVLQAIALSLDARYERTEDAVTFYSGRSRE